MTVYLVLGAGGFIGSRLVDRLAKLEMPVYSYNRLDHTVINYLTKKQESLEQFIEDKNSIQVINCLAAWGEQVQSKIIKAANYELPISIFKIIASHKNVRSWIQISSYYYFHFLSTGIDKNEYAYYKRKLSSELKSFVSQIKKQDLQILDIYIPHIYGNRDRTERLVGLILQHAHSNTPLKLTSGKQILPLLHIEDCVSGIISLMNHWDRQKGYKEVYISEQIQLSIKDIVSMVMKFRPLKAEYGAIVERENEFYEPIECPMESYRLEQYLDFNEYLKAQMNRGNHE